MAQVPEVPRIDRAALERIIRRAAELQAAERDLGEGLTPDDVLRLGEEVGISGTYLRQALLEEQGGTLQGRERGLLVRLVGPRYVAAHRVIPESAASVAVALQHWMTENELLVVKRRLQNQMSWEARRDVFSTVKRELQIGGRSYALAKAHEVAAQVVPLDADRCHVRLVADLDNTRKAHVRSGIGLALAGAATSAVGITLGVLVPVALAPLVLGGAAGWAAAASRRSRLERVQVALEQVLDRLEHREIRLPQPGGGGPLARITEEIRRNLGV